MLVILAWLLKRQLEKRFSANLTASCLIGLCIEFWPGQCPLSNQRVRLQPNIMTSASKGSLSWRGQWCRCHIKENDRSTRFCIVTRSCIRLCLDTVEPCQGHHPKPWSEASFHVVLMCKVSRITNATTWPHVSPADQADMRMSSAREAEVENRLWAASWRRATSFTPLIAPTHLPVWTPTICTSRFPCLLYNISYRLLCNLS